MFTFFLFKMYILLYFAFVVEIFKNFFKQTSMFLNRYHKNLELIYIPAEEQNNG